VIIQRFIMKIAILSRNKNLYSTRRLKEAGEAMGHQVDIIDTLHCYIATLLHGHYEYALYGSLSR
jgi:hypothetical protein